MVVQDLSARPGKRPCREPAPCYFAQKQAARETRADWLRTYSLRTRQVKANEGKNRPESKDLAGGEANGEQQMATRHSPLLKPKGSPAVVPGFHAGKG